MRARNILLIMFTIAVASCFSNQAVAQIDSSSSKHIGQEIGILNQLSNEINTSYGFKDGVPRINMGPCGPFAKDFYEQWNARFKNKVDITFIMLKNSKPPICAHILVKLPDGNYFDGGNGVVTDSALLSKFPNSTIEEMKEFDLKLLEKNAGGLNRKYPNCPNYSNELTTKMIDKYLTILSNDKR